MSVQKKQKNFSSFETKQSFCQYIHYIEQSVNTFRNIGEAAPVPTEKFNQIPRLELGKYNKTSPLILFPNLYFHYR